MDFSRLGTHVSSIQGLTAFRGTVFTFQFRVGTLSTAIRARITFEPTLPEPFGIEVSHFIHTPTQGGPYRTSVPYTDTPENGVVRALRGIVEYYNEAVNQGHSPSESWLVPNANWTEDLPT